jgi:methylated-DNA-[protein]-cysteine S-methyltransferase
MSERTHTVMDSPVGPLTLVATDGALCGLYMVGQRHLPDAETFGMRDGAVLTEAVGRDGGVLSEAIGRDGTMLTAAIGRDGAVLTEAIGQVGEYFAGERTHFDVPMTFVGTEFQRRVWTALRDIPYGRTVSYGEIARQIGNPAASRAVGLANGRNPISIVVPCHRVVGSTGDLTGYGGGLERKRFLLEFEEEHRNNGYQML